MVAATRVARALSPRPALQFWQIWNMAFGFFGIQMASAVQGANVSRNHARPTYSMLLRSERWTHVIYPRWGRKTSQVGLAKRVIQGCLAFLTLLVSACASIKSEHELPLAVPAMATAQTACSGSELLIHFPSPDWRDQIIYFIFTDRFDDGDPGNNDQNAGEFDPSREHYFSGGDIKGIAERLDYIQGLGATAIWLTPVVYNQWTSEANDFTGYSGYYAVDFSSIDPHFGTLEDYQALSSALHCRSMYLIKDIVVNHTGNFFGYDGPYDPADTSRNFKLLQSPDALQPAPTLPPFDKIDRNNPEHFAAGIYNWTPSITDYENLGERQFTYQLAALADVNTKNPVVVDAFKDIYGDWIEKAGIDAIRIDTVRYVEPDFFRRFLYDGDGLAARALATGRDDFLVFGEVLDYSQPFENSGEQALAKYLSGPDGPILPAVISFPLKQEIKSVFGQGEPTAQIAYRLMQHMRMYTDPYITPTLVDNHDVARFLSSGSEEGFKQSFALIFTIPGIPTIYQGSEQGFTETRQAMFAGGYLSDRDHFDTDTEFYRFIVSLSELRTSEIALRRGTLDILADNLFEAGLLAYRRTYGAEVIDVIFNTSDQDILVDHLELPGVADGPLETVFATNFDRTLIVQGRALTTVLPPRAIIVTRPSMAGVPTPPSVDTYGDPLTLVADFAAGEVLSADVRLSGRANTTERDILIVKNGRIYDAEAVSVAPDGTWSLTYPVKNLGDETFYLVAYAPDTRRVSERIEVRTRVDQPAFSTTISDPRGDDRGPTGNYIDMQQPNASGQKDILEVRASTGGDILQLGIVLAEVTSEWLPPNQFDNVSFSVFLDLPSSEGATRLPQLNTDMPSDLRWDIGHVAYGWGNTMFAADGATDERAGRRFASAPRIEVDEATRTIRFTYDGSDFGVDSWDGVTAYITTWDIAGEGAYVKLAAEPSDWAFGGGNEGAPKVLDDVIVEISADR